MSQALERIREHNERTRAWLVILDDDPTGSQCVYGVSVLLDPSVGDLLRLARARTTTFIWTNSRSEVADEARRISSALVRDIHAAAGQAGVRPVIVSRSDSTLRGHFAAEIQAISEACRAAGRPVDGVVFVPAFLEAGRFTADDVQWVVQADGSLLRAAETEFALDASFGYEERDLRSWVAARLGLSTDSVRSVSLDVLRNDLPSGGALLKSLSGGEVAIGNASAPADLELLVLACQSAELSGRHLLYRTGPSLVRALMGQAPQAPLGMVDLAADVSLIGAAGLTVVGSHTALSTRQIEIAVTVHGLPVVELSVEAVLDDLRRSATIEDASARLTEALRHGDCALVTSRAPALAAGDTQDSLRIARTVSDAVVAVVHGLPADLPLRYVVAKGGITSHDVATRGLGVRSATVLGQMFPGQVSVLRLDRDSRRPGLVYVVFPGNVGGDESLAQIIDALGTP